MLSRLAPAADPRVLVGPETLDDAGVIAVRADLAICFTADFITPLVDEPRAWGQIAAANSLSDVFAMGARPLAALNLVCWPSDLPAETLADVLAGGADTVAEAGCFILGGHTIQDREPKYGLAVIGTVDPQRILRNRGAMVGDLLYLTKPLGTGAITTAIKADLATPESIMAVVESMTRLNAAAADAALVVPARALTDVTGFGLAGHLAEMLGPEGKLGARISLSAIPLLPGTQDCLAMGLLPAGAYRNRDAYRERVRWSAEVPSELEMLLYDPQTSGGLLAAIPAEAREVFEREASRRATMARQIGIFTDTGRIEVVP